jgi:hypothetical protein
VIFLLMSDDVFTAGVPTHITMLLLLPPPPPPLPLPLLLLLLWS